MKSRKKFLAGHFCFFSLVALAGTLVVGAERFQNFDHDPGWAGHQNRSAKPQVVHQDFGWSNGTTNAGEPPGEIGGLIAPAAEPAFYARKFPRRTYQDRLFASGRLLVEKGSGHALLGFFDANSLNEWRTPNTIALRIHQRGELFHCHLEYCTSQWRAGAGIIGQYDKVRDRMNAKEMPAGQVYRWSLEYFPGGQEDPGRITATLGTNTASRELSSGHKSDGAQFNYFGLVNVLKQYDGAGRLWLKDVVINGQREIMSTDPMWEGSGNRRTYESLNVRPRFDFGFSSTQFAGGKGSGELGGLFFRGDCRYAERLAAYGDRLNLLTLERPLRASGKVSLRRGVSDSTTLIGFYHSEESLAINSSQQFSTPKNFLGAAIEGPSGEGFYFYPVYRGHDGDPSSGMGTRPPRIYPDGASHDWTLAYDPGRPGTMGKLTITLDGQSTSRDLPVSVGKRGTILDRFGLVTPWIDGNGQHVYFDDLSYTASQE